MEVINNHTDFPVLSPRTAKPSQGPRHLLVSTQLASEDTSPIGPKAASSWTLEMSPTCSQTQRAILTHFSICPLQLQEQQAARPTFVLSTTSQAGCSSQNAAQLAVHTRFEMGRTLWRQGCALQEEVKHVGKRTTSYQPSWQGPLPRNSAQLSRVAPGDFPNITACPSTLN